jgi:integrating conjugative element relaxase (TIGR03760 family)
MEPTSLAIATLATVGCALLAKSYWPRNKQTTTSPQRDPVPARSPGGLPLDVLPVLSGAQLLARPQYAHLVHSILNKTGLSTDNNLRDALPVLQAYAQFVQLLPASEAHHHAHPGGLLQHTLEVVDFALTYRRSYMLPIGAAPERVNELRHVWTFGVLLAAAFHDVGKPMSDLTIRLYGAQCPKSGKLWQPIAGDMLVQGAEHYQVGFNAQRSYQDHQGLSLVVMQRMVASDTMAWLSGSDAQLLTELMAMLSGEPSEGSILAKLVKQSDQESTKLNLLTGSRTRFKTARETPLVDVLDESLRRLLASGQLQLNRPGGHGFVWGGPVGQGDLLMVCPRVVDEMRKFLASALTDGSRAIPTDNLILYGTWIDYNRIRPLMLPPQAGSHNSTLRAVWKVRIAGIPTALSVLRIPRDSLTLAGLEDFPEAFSGVIEVVESNGPEPVEQPSAHPAAASGVNEASIPTLPDTSPPSSPPAPSASASLLDQLMAGSTVATMATTAPAASGAVAVPEKINVFALRAVEAASDQYQVGQLALTGGLVVDELEASTQSELHPLPGLLGLATGQASSTAKAAVSKKTVPTMKVRTQTLATASPDLVQFEQWLRNGLLSGKLRYNAGDALVHFYKAKPVEGQEPPKTVGLLVTPAVYQNYFKRTQPDKWPESLPTKDIPRSVWLPLQRAVFAAHPHRVELQGKIPRSVFRFATQSRSMLHMNVLLDPERLFGQVPESNPFIVGEVTDPALSPMAVTV